MTKAKVTKVIDGDTFKIKGGKYIRLAGVDTPEKGRRGYAAARDELRNLIEGKTISFTEVGKSYDRIVADDVKVGSKSVISTMKKHNKG